LGLCQGSAAVATAATAAAVIVVGADAIGPMLAEWRQRPVAHAAWGCIGKVYRVIIVVVIGSAHSLGLH